MATILGLHYGHHGTACIVRDGKLIAALSHERLRKLNNGMHLGKYCHGASNELIDCLLQSTGIQEAEIDYIALSDWSKQFAFHDITVRVAGKEVDNLWNRIYDNNCLSLEVRLGGRSIPGYYIGHQLSHAAAVFYTSPFDKAFCFTMDASGADHRNNSLISYGEGNKIKSIHCPGLNIGFVYNYFTEYLGIGMGLFKAGSLMALAAYGEVLPKVIDNLDSYVKDSFIYDTSYYVWNENLWKDLSGSEEFFTHQDSDTKRAQCIAKTIQYIFQETILRCINSIDTGGVENLCLSGGSMLNCVANSYVLHKSNFKNVHLFPACGDDGCCVGTALYVSHHVLDEKRGKYRDSDLCYLGPYRPSVEPDYRYIVRSLDRGKIVAWCCGRSEFGPRALGNRSLFADPRIYSSRDKLNFKVKNREWYRPLAPIVMEEFADDWFDFPTKSPFMLHTMDIKKPDLIPAVCHIDNSARIQTVNEESNPYVYRLLKEFYYLTGVPVLINTSLNGNGESIVETGEHALDFFNKGEVDILVLDGRMYLK